MKVLLEVSSALDRLSAMLGTLHATNLNGEDVVMIRAAWAKDTSKVLEDMAKTLREVIEEKLDGEDKGS